MIEKGLKGAIGELKESGSSATESLQGAGFGGLSLTGMEAGHSGLAGDFEDFCEKWEWGVRALVQNANGLAQRLGLSAGMAYEEDQYAAGTMKVALNSVSYTGNPHATEEEVAKQGYGDIMTPDAPDYSAESFQKAGDDITQEWKDTGRELTSEGRGGMYMDLTQGATGVSDEQVAAAQDRAFGPSPEERAAAQQPQQGAAPGQGEGGEG
ncbi:hypothetical protein [Streptomyces iconiensis]|uniref:hypothetical protein n=1 Tax=Streptomyces iconiensis TaxID=1384038 RepID=UPI003D2F8B81